MPTPVLLVTVVRRVTAGLDQLGGLGVPLHVAVGVEAARAARPALASGFASGALKPFYAAAHDVHPLLAGADEWVDELRLSEELVHDVLGAARPLRRGVVCAEPTRALIGAMEAAGFDYLVPGQALARVGERLVAAPACVHDFDQSGLAGLKKVIERLRADDTAIVEADALLEAVTPPWVPRTGEVFEGDVPETAAAAALVDWLLAAFGWERAPRILAATLVEEGLDRLPPRARLPLHARRLKAAARAEAYGIAALICDALAVESRVPGAAAHPAAELPAGTLAALARTGRSLLGLEPAENAYAELAAMRFAGASRWRAFCESLRDWFRAEAAITAVLPRVAAGR